MASVAPSFLSNCLWGWVILINKEVWQAGDPAHTFDWVDIIVSLLGSVGAFMLHRYVVGASDVRDLDA